jgi:hypothetical protein
MFSEGLAEKSEGRWWCAEMHRLRGVFLTAVGAEETQIEASFSAAIRTAKEQKSVSLEKRAEGTYAAYRRLKASDSGGRGFRTSLVVSCSSLLFDPTSSCVCCESRNAEQLLKRMKALPTAVKQAQDRIIGERQVAG